MDRTAFASALKAAGCPEYQANKIALAIYGPLGSTRIHSPHKAALAALRVVLSEPKTVTDKQIAQAFLGIIERELNVVEDDLKRAFYDGGTAGIRYAGRGDALRDLRDLIKPDRHVTVSFESPRAPVEIDGATRWIEWPILATPAASSDNELPDAERINEANVAAVDAFFAIWDRGPKVYRTALLALNAALNAKSAPVAVDRTPLALRPLELTQEEADGLERIAAARSPLIGKTLREVPTAEHTEDIECPGCGSGARYLCTHPRHRVDRTEALRQAEDAALAELQRNNSGEWTRDALISFHLGFRAGIASQQPPEITPESARAVIVEYGQRLHGGDKVAHVSPTAEAVEAMIHALAALYPKGPQTAQKGDAK